jgi:DNA-directed RNA polymerase subunit RPC12/RpoP
MSLDPICNHRAVELGVVHCLKCGSQGESDRKGWKARYSFDDGEYQYMCPECWKDHIDGLGVDQQKIN